MGGANGAEKQSRWHFAGGGEKPAGGGKNAAGWPFANTSCDSLFDCGDYGGCVTLDHKVSSFLIALPRQPQTFFLPKEKRNSNAFAQVLFSWVRDFGRVEVRDGFLETHVACLWMCSVIFAATKKGAVPPQATLNHAPDMRKKMVQKSAIIILWIPIFTEIQKNVKRHLFEIFKTF